MKNGEAVKFILENYKGFAEGASETALGPVKQMMNSIGDLGEELGKVFMPYLQELARLVKDFVQWLAALPPSGKAAIVVIGGLAAAIGPLALGLGTIIKLLPAIKIGLAALTGPIGVITLAIGCSHGGIYRIQRFVEAGVSGSDFISGPEIYQGWMVD